MPAETFHGEWERRRLRNVVHLTIGGCLGPCALANVALLLFDGQAQWFHSMNSDARRVALYDHVEAMLDADACLPPPPALAPYHFTASAWQPRPDGQPVDDARLGARRRAAWPARRLPSGVTARRPDAQVDRVVAVMEGAAALPRKNGELVFEEPWQGRVFGMAVALHEQRRLRLGRVPPGADRPDRRRRGARPARSSTTRSGSPTFERLLAAQAARHARRARGDDLPVRVRRARRSVLTRRGAAPPLYLRNSGG